MLDTDPKTVAAALNAMCFGKDDEFSQLETVRGCRVFLLEADGAPQAYALVAPGRIAKLERYGTHPDYRGRGLGGRILADVAEQHPVIFTYVSVLNLHSVRSLLAAGYVPVGQTNEWMSLVYVHPRLQ